MQRLQQIKFQLDQGHAHHTTVISSTHYPPRDLYPSIQGAVVQQYSPAILELDLTEAHSLADRAQSALELFGHIDILINNAGISSRGSVTETTIKVDRRVMETNFFGPVSFTKGTGHNVLIICSKLLYVPKLAQTKRTSIHISVYCRSHF